MAQPELLTESAFDAWLAQIHVSSVGELVAYQKAGLGSGVLQVEMSVPDPNQLPVPTTLPIAAAVVIRDAGFSVAQLLMESKMVREQLAEQGIAVPTRNSLPALNPFLIVWVIPLTVFDDTAWPGTGVTTEALRASRRHNAGMWLGPEGIAIAGVDV